jgi:hypothetical protein
VEQLNYVVILGLTQGTSTLVVGGTRYPNHEPNILTANPVVRNRNVFLRAAFITSPVPPPRLMAAGRFSMITVHGL